MKIKPTYGAIECVKEICAPWIDAFAGDEWGENAGCLFDFSTDYGFSNEDVATVTEILVNNIIEMEPYLEETIRNHSGGKEVETILEDTRAEARDARDRWLRDSSYAEDAKTSIDQIPEWFFHA